MICKCRLLGIVIHNDKNHRVLSNEIPSHFRFIKFYGELRIDIFNFYHPIEIGKDLAYLHEVIAVKKYKHYFSLSQFSMIPFFLNSSHDFYLIMSNESQILVNYYF